MSKKEIEDNIDIIEETPKKKRNWFWVILPIFTLLFCAGCVYTVIDIFNSSAEQIFKNIEDVALPSFTNMKASDVVENDEYNFEFTVEENYSKDYAEGVIYDQSPKAPKTVKDNAKVVLRVSKGVKYVIVPDLYTLSKDKALEELIALDLTPHIEYVVDPTVEPDQVVKIEPAPGEEIIAGDTVIIGISREKIESNVIVPNLVGVPTYEETNRILAENRMSLGEHIFVPSELPAGTVIQQFTAPGEKVAIGSKIDIIFSAGIPVE